MSSLLISIDPGVRMTGVAVFKDGDLSSAWLSKGDDGRHTALCARSEIAERYPDEVWEYSHVAIEIPRVYSARKVDPADLISLAKMAGCFIGFMGPYTTVTEYFPAQWKGQVPKDIMVERIKGKLSDEERGRVELPSAKSYQHNVWDAVGIGLHHRRRQSVAANNDPA